MSKHPVLRPALVALLVAMSAGITATAGNGAPLNDDSANRVSLALFGDAPYGTTPTDTAEFQATPAFIDSVNSDPQVRLVMHVGDIHSGKQYCTQSYDQSVFDLWTRFKDPLVYTPGDNEWTDCHKSGEGGNLTDSQGNPVDYANGNPVANLALIRSIFFPSPGLTLGGRKKQVVSQADAYDPAHPSDANYVENVMWEQSKTLFVTVNVPGGSNNDADKWYGAPLTSAQTDEMNARTSADLRWLDAAFARAEADGVDGVVIGLQADMWDLDGKTSAHLTNYEPIISDIAQNTTAFGRPVLLFNGDSHVYRSDNPLAQGAPCVSDPSSGAAATACGDDDWNQHPSYDVPNFHRVVVHGSTFPLEWLKLTIEPGASHPTTAKSFGPFSWERETQ
jgi:hypothetical protein